MEKLAPRLSFEIIWRDGNMLKAFVEACNSSYMGSSKIYLDQGRLKKFADALARFPTNPEDKRHFKFSGELAFLTLDFYCLNRACHSAVFIEIGDEKWSDARRNQASFELRVEPAAIDRFITMLEQVDTDAGGIAVLEGLI